MSNTDGFYAQLDLTDKDIHIFKALSPWSLSIVLILQEGMAYELIVGTTKIVSGNSLTETFVEKLG